MSLYQYYRDGLNLWKGPVAPLENLHYARLEGWYRHEDRGVWVLRRSEPDPNWIPITKQQATRIMQLVSMEA